MSNPIVVDLPHTLGREEAKRRLERGMGRISQQIPGGAEVESAWTGDRLDLRVQAMGQDIRSKLDVQEKIVRMEVILPPGLSFFGNGIAALLKRQGEAMLEDKTKKGG
ncbi:MAG: polyhydroxyalkanoic acid system family protein [Alphaproteobacteria bacterium]|nr:polyhydroxyalkanoic acid system family protein [Alphaproteobacteria bacterium]MBV9372178.1 polyhydroxyalkanoic acid system family protein [Alphaproteobacteria bacterium]MBV9902309.1 polyhydroxyalkanoic acid system family protein [Alphaproteobacteria bacterium]